MFEAVKIGACGDSDKEQRENHTQGRCHGSEWESGWELRNKRMQCHLSAKAEERGLLLVPSVWTRTENVQCTKWVTMGVKNPF